MQNDLETQRRATAKALAKEERKRKRAIELARGLSDEDLIGIIASRASAKAKAKAKAKGKAKGKAKAKAKAAAGGAADVVVGEPEGDDGAVGGDGAEGDAEVSAAPAGGD